MTSKVLVRYGVVTVAECPCRLSDRARLRDLGEVHQSSYRETQRRCYWYALIECLLISILTRANHAAYVHSVMDEQNNLFLRTNARVSRVLFEGNKAVGVAYVPARNRTHQGKVQETIVKARRYVVLSSGTLGTPQILERSGIGSASRLRRLDLKVVSDLPGVG